MRTTSRKALAWRLLGAVALAFATSMVLTWILHERMTRREMHKLFGNVFSDVAVDIRERVDRQMFRQAMALRDKVYVMREEPWWNDVAESSRRLREVANELGVDEVTIADASGMLTHSARPEEVGALDFTTAEGQAREFAALLDDKYELAQPLLPNTMRGDLVKYVGVWMPDGGFVQVGGRPKSVRNLARTALTGLTHGWHVSGDGGGIIITTGNGTIISHPEAANEGGQWSPPGDDTYWEKRTIEGFPVYIVIPKRTAIVERRVLVATSSFLNGMALVLASVLVGIVIAGYVRTQIAAQRKKEMEMASAIQESSIPRVFPPFAEEPRMDVFATMHSARDVGGDFYDFYFSGPGRLAFLVADVSGKGVPAALFMMRAKATVKGMMQSGLSLAEIAPRVNDALSRDNDANMFVTAWIGDIDLVTGVVSYINAGHNPPVVISGGGGSAEYVKPRSGLMFGGMPGMKYKVHQLRLAPGDMLYLYTDGITEQPDASGALFGEERLLDSIRTMLSAGVAALNRDSSPLLGALFSAVIAHGSGVEQADDCTQLILRYNGARAPEGNGSGATASNSSEATATRPPAPDAARATRSFPATQAGVAAASAFLDECAEPFKAGRPSAEAPAANSRLQPFSLQPSTLSSLHIILDEIASNIVKHSGAGGFDFEVAIRGGASPAVELVFSDDGKAFDPLAKPEPDTSLPAWERPIGGLGIMMVRKMASDVGYRREGERNVLSVVMKCPASA